MGIFIHQPTPPAELPGWEMCFSFKTCFQPSSGFSHPLFVVGCWLFSWPRFFFGPGSTTASGQAEPIRGEWRFFFNCLAFFQKKNGIVIVGSRCKSLVTPTTRVICRVYHIRITPPKTNILNSKIAGLSRCFEPFPFGGFLGIFSGSSR